MSFDELRKNIDSCFNDLAKIQSISMLPDGRPRIVSSTGGLDKMEHKILAVYPKNGFKTSEFWATTLTVVASAAGAYAEVLPAKWAIGLSAVATIAYTLSRSIVKARTK